MQSSGSNFFIWTEIEHLILWVKTLTLDWICSLLLKDLNECEIQILDIWTHCSEGFFM